MPSLTLTSGRKFSTTTSAFFARRLKVSRPLGSLRLSVIARLLRCKFWKSAPSRGPPSCSPVSSVSASILMTLAPQSASWRTQVGPERTRVRSSTVKRDRACDACGIGMLQNSGGIRAVAAALAGAPSPKLLRLSCARTHVGQALAAIQLLDLSEIKRVLEVGDGFLE